MRLRSFFGCSIVILCAQVSRRFLWQFPSLPRTSLRPQYEEQTWRGTRRQLWHWQRGVPCTFLVGARLEKWQV